MIFPAFNSSKFSFGEVLGEIEVNNFLINTEAGSNIIEKRGFCEFSEERLSMFIVYKYQKKCVIAFIKRIRS